MALSLEWANASSTFAFSISTFPLCAQQTDASSSQGDTIDWLEGNEEQTSWLRARAVVRKRIKRATTLWA